MATVLVTGGGGYIGSILVVILLDAGHTVTVLDRFFFGRDVLDGLDAHPRLRAADHDFGERDAP